MRSETLFSLHNMRAISWSIVRTYYPEFSPVEDDVVSRDPRKVTSPSPRLGAGDFGTVYKTLNASGKVVAIKVAPFDDAAQNELRDEMTMLTNLHGHADPDHLLPHVIRHLDAFTSTYNRGSPELFLVMEYVSGRDFDTYFHDFKSESAEPRMNQAFQFAYQLFRAMAFFHSHDVVHRDIHLGNILIRGDDNTPLFIDFGLACGGPICDTRPTSISLGMINEEIRQKLSSGDTVDQAAWQRNDCTQLAMTILGAALWTKNLRVMVHDHTTTETGERAQMGPHYVLRDADWRSRTFKILAEMNRSKDVMFPGNMARLESLFTSAIKGHMTAMEMAEGMRDAMDKIHGVYSPMNFLTSPGTLVLHL